MSLKLSSKVSFAIFASLACALLFALSLQAQTLTKDSLQGMEWRLVGPFRGGRVEAVAGIPGNPYVYYFGAVAGGLWKTVDGGVDWMPIFDKESNPSIGAIAIAPSDPNVIYVGTGEPCFRGDITYGNGMYKSVDAGKTWTHIGLEDSRHIGRILIDPQNPDIVYVAAIGHAFGPNEERGVFRSTDGGKTWDKVLFKDDKTGAVDIEFAGGNSHIIYAAMYQVLRTPWNIISGGPGSGLYKSSDGGSTWQQIKGHGFPDVLLGKIGIATSPADPQRVYALVEAAQDKGGLYVSHDQGDTWQFVSGDHRLIQRAFYYIHVFADPSDADRIYVQDVGSYRSIDAGKDWQQIRVPHGDNHALWIDPKDPKRLIAGNDGGATISVDGGENWTAQDNQPTAQFYHVAADDQFRYYLYGAQQDNSTVAIASSTDHGSIGRQDWYDVGGGESGYIAPLPQGKIVYAGGNYGIITRWDKQTEEAHMISPYPVNADGSGAADNKYRFQWTEPILTSPFDSHELYIAAQVLFKSTDEGQTWTVISPDLTRNDKSKEQVPGGPITKDSTSVEFYDTIFSVALSPVDRGLIWAGSDDGLVHVTRDGGKNWTDVTPQDMPAWSKISMIEASPFDAGTAYVAVDRHMLDDLAPYAYKTTDFGKTWTKITDGIPNGSFLRSVREDPKRKGLLYAGTETGVFVSFDDGANWQSLQLNLPVVPVHDLIVHGDDLAIATHGRSFWVLDDISPLRQLKAGDLDADVHLFQPAPAYRTRGGGFFRARGAIGSNPPNGVIVDYSLKSAPKGDITMEILDAKGQVVQKFSSKQEHQAGEQASFRGRSGPPPLPKKAGLNRYVWNMQYPMPRSVPNAQYDGGFPTGILALPGKYEVKLTVEGTSYTAPIELRMDPRAKISEADLQKQFTVGEEARNLEETDHTMVLEIRNLRDQLDALENRLGKSEGDNAVRTSADDIKKKLDAIENQLISIKSTANEDQLNYGNMLSDQLAQLEDVIDDSDVAVPQADVDQLAIFRGQLEKLQADWQVLTKTDLPNLNELMRKNHVAAVGISAPIASDSSDN
jgi:photosystem II stability/assembly factor-like uncharacterized protein